MVAGYFRGDRKAQTNAARLARPVALAAQEAFADTGDKRLIQHLAVVGQLTTRYWYTAIPTRKL